MRLTPEAWDLVGLCIIYEWTNRYGRFQILHTIQLHADGSRQKTTTHALCNSTPMNLLSARDRLRLEWSERKGLRVDGGKNKDRYTTQLVVRGPSYQLLEDVTANYHQWIFLYQFARAHPHHAPQCSTFYGEYIFHSSSRDLHARVTGYYSPVPCKTKHRRVPYIQIFKNSTLCAILVYFLALLHRRCQVGKNKQN